MAAISSNGTGGGNWSAGASWSGGVAPVAGDVVTIVSPDVVTMDGTQACSGITINAGATLSFHRTTPNDLTLTGDMVVNGTLDWGDIATPITGKSTINFTGAFGIRNNVAGAIIRACGATKTTNTYLTTAVTAATASFTVNDATGWAVGDKVIFATTADGNTGSQTEVMTILTIDTVTGVGTTTANFVYAHQSGGRVGNFSKTCQLIGDGTNNTFLSVKYYSSTTTTQHLMRHVEFQYAGRTTNLEYGGFSIDGNSQTMDGFEEMTDLTFFETKLSGIDVYNARGRQTINNTAFYASTTTGVHGVWLRQGSIVTLNALVVYRHQFGVTSIWSQGGTAVILNNPWFLGCYSRCINLDSAQGWEINNPRITSSVDGIFNQTGAAHTVNGGHIGMDTANGAEYTASLLNAFSAANTTLGVILTKDTSYNYTTAMVKNLALAIPGTQFIVSNRDVDPLLQEIHAPTGSIYRDNTTVRTAGTASLRMEPTSSTDALSNTWNIIAPDSTPVAISAFVRKNSTYGSSNLPSITISGLGITPVTSTMADVNDSWELVSLTAMQTTGADGILTLTFDGQSAGAGARCFITDIAAPAATAITTGSLEYWADGQPAKLIAANFLSATDVWNAQVTDLAVAGSMGQYITQPFFMSPLEIDENVYENAQSIAISALTGKTITLKLYAASAPSVQVGSDIVMTEPVPEMYVAQIDWSSISGLEPDYYYVQATSGIHSSVGIIEVHQVDPQERQLQHTTTNR